MNKPSIVVAKFDVYRGLTATEVSFSNGAACVSATSSAAGALRASGSRSHWACADYLLTEFSVSTYSAVDMVSIAAYLFPATRPTTFQFEFNVASMSHRYTHYSAFGICSHKALSPARHTRQLAFSAATHG